ncbi:MAG: NAD-dependent DNA ligase LigA [Candidatus Heimdallarchaeota archaeon]
MGSATQSRNKVEEIKKLANQILFHKKKYYDGEPVISDEAYDSLEDKLRELDPTNPVLFMVGSNEAGKVFHDPPMLSSQKTTNVDDVVKWSGGRDLMVGNKIDGVSLSLIYENGRLIQAATRGNGTMGDDTTIAAMKVAAIPKSIPEITPRINIRGELFMRLSEFARIKKTESDQYSSPRNLAAGTIKQKDLSLLDKRVLSFSAFELLGLRDEEATLEEKVGLLLEWGFETTEFKLLRSPSKESIEALYRNTASARGNLDFEIDGLVLKYNDAKERANAGATAHHPRWMMALKFRSQGKLSKVNSITWQVGRLGTITPVAELEPVEVMGAVIQRATLHNADFLETLDVAPGDSVWVIRSGDVIPKITEVVEKGPNSALLPSRCPSCDSKLRRDGVNLLCNSPICRDREIQRIRHWIKITDIKGLGSKNVAKLYDNGLIRHFADLYDKNLTERKLVSLLGKNGSKIFQGIQETKNIPFHLFLAGLGIETLGKQMAKVLTNHFSTYEALKNVTADQLMEIEGISEITAGKILEGIHDPMLADHLLEKGVVISEGTRILKRESQPPTRLTDFFGSKDESPEFGIRPQGLERLRDLPKVYVTGTIPGMTKKEVQTFLEQHNYEWAAISKKLTLLIVGEKPGKNKLEKAQKYGIPQKSWDEFIKELR